MTPKRKAYYRATKLQKTTGLEERCVSRRISSSTHVLRCVLHHNYPIINLVQLFLEHLKSNHPSSSPASCAKKTFTAHRISTIFHTQKKTSSSSRTPSAVVPTRDFGHQESSVQEQPARLKKYVQMQPPGKHRISYHSFAQLDCWFYG